MILHLIQCYVKTSISAPVSPYVINHLLILSDRGQLFLLRTDVLNQIRSMSFRENPKDTITQDTPVKVIE